MPNKDGVKTKAEAAKDFFIRGRELKLTSGEKGIFLTKSDVLVGDISGKKRRESFKALCKLNLIEFGA